MSGLDVGVLVESARHLCEQQEDWARAEFFHGMNAGQRAELTAGGIRPWRGIMSPALVSLVNVLEDAGHYDAPLEPGYNPVEVSGELARKLFD